MTTLRFDHVSKVFRQRHSHAPDGNLQALRDVDFECEEGEVLGLIGRNGCGKSTLLKLAAGVTSPTSGKVTCVKPVAPMLELGAGFHPDLTGRDNVRLNACLLGLGWRISPSLFDEIVAFAELEQHVDTPVKHYSSGMYTRLGFAVAVHSPARLLLVDEVLSVGDRLFQEKCFARMQYLRDRGTTIVLVSHDNWWIRNFCGRALVIDEGRVVADAKPDEALQAYDCQLRGLATPHRI
jgi:ABC-type polysaccharide/polyol phosphate transport system ATPase subunit